MKTTVALLLALAAPLSAQDDLPRPDNAALCYWRAIAQLPRPTTAEETEAHDAQAALAAGVVDGTKAYDASLDAWLETRAAAIAEVHAAASIERCDFGLHYEDGPEMLMPHLSGVRDVARAVLVAARKDEAGGDAGAAAARALEVLRLARHVDQDGVLISSLVAAAIAGQALDVLAGVVDGAPEGSGVPALVDGALEADEGIDFARALRMEAKVFGRTFAGLDADRMDDLVMVLGGSGDGGGWDSLAEEWGIPAETLRDPDYWKGGVAEYERRMEAMAALFGRPHAERQGALEAVEAEVESGHAMLRMLMPAVARCGETDARVDARLALVRVLARLRAAPGEAPETLESRDLPADPATGKAFTVRPVEGGVRIESAIERRSGEEERLGYVLHRR